MLCWPTLCVPKKTHVWARAACGLLDGRNGRKYRTQDGLKGVRRQAASEQTARHLVNLIDLRIWPSLAY